VTMKRTRSAVLAGLAVLLTATYTGAELASAHSSPLIGQPNATATRDGRIVFTDFNTGQLYSVEPNGAGLTQLTHVPGGQFAGRPSWSPDGRQILFDSDLGGDIRIYRINADGSHLHQVRSDMAGWADLSARYTQDATHIIYDRCRPDPPGGCALFMVRADGTHRVAVTHFVQPPLDQTDFFASPSPDGVHVAFTRFGAGGINAQVWLSRMDGTRATALTRPATEAQLPAWSPDGRTLLVTANVSRIHHGIDRIDANGSHVFAFARPPSPHSDSSARYAPQGDRIIFVSDAAYPDLSGQDLWLMRADGSGRTRFALPGLTEIGFPDWGPTP
jgi:Tol biopolymer transport system component